jgi:hypothetical protein
MRKVRYTTNAEVTVETISDATPIQRFQSTVNGARPDPALPGSELR